MSQIVFVDLETTGLDPLRHGIVEIGAIYTIDGHALGRQRIQVNPGPVEYTEEAYEINGYTEQRASRGIPLDEALRTFDDPIKPGAILAGWNVGFDFGFLKSAYACLNRKFPFGYHLLDIQSVFRFMKLCGRYKASVSLEKAAGACKVARKLEKAHSAVTDVDWTYRLFQWAQERIQL